MIFEQHASGYYPIDESAHDALAKWGFVAPLDTHAFKAMNAILEADCGKQAEIYECN